MRRADDAAADDAAADDAAADDAEADDAAAAYLEENEKDFLPPKHTANKNSKGSDGVESSSESEGEEQEDDDHLNGKEDNFAPAKTATGKEVPLIIDVLSNTTGTSISESIASRQTVNLFKTLNLQMKVFVGRYFRKYKGLFGKDKTMKGNFMREFVEENQHLTVSADVNLDLTLT
jgi:hypothetical protein